MEEQQRCACKKQRALTNDRFLRERKCRIQCVQRERPLGKCTAGDEAETIRQGQREPHHWKEHPQIEQPGAKTPQCPAAAQRKNQRRQQRDHSGKDQRAPLGPMKQPAIKHERQQDHHKGNKRCSDEGRAAAHHAVDGWFHRRGSCQRFSLRFGFAAEKAQEKQRAHPQKRQHAAEIVAKAPGRIRRCVRDAKDCHTIQHLPAVKQDHQQQAEKEFVAEQSPALIEKYFTQGSTPPHPARRQPEIPHRSDTATEDRSRA